MTHHDDSDTTAPIDTPAGDGPIYTVPARVSTAAELDALPVGTVVLDRHGFPWLRSAGDGWVTTTNAGTAASPVLFGPLSVVYPLDATPAPDGDAVERAARVLALHQIESHGMTYGSPDTCTCGARLLPEPGEEDVRIRRGRAFAQHQAAALAAAREPVTQDEAPARPSAPTVTAERVWIKVRHEGGNTVRGPVETILRTHLAKGWRLDGAVEVQR